MLVYAVAWQPSALLPAPEQLQQQLPVPAVQMLLKAVATWMTTTLSHVDMPHILNVVQICNYRLLLFLRFCLSRQLYVVRLVRIALKCHFGVIPF